MNARAKELADKIVVDPQTGGVTLPKPEWKGWTLSQEMASFDEQQRQRKE